MDSKRWTVLATVEDIISANMVSALLEDEDILCMIANENTASLLPYLRQGVQVLVKETDFLRARAIFDKFDQANFKAD